jgi:hypothetical protein
MPFVCKNSLPKAYISVLGKPDLPENTVIRGQFCRISTFCVKLQPFCALFPDPDRINRVEKDRFSDGNGSKAEVPVIVGISNVRIPVSRPGPGLFFPKNEVPPGYLLKAPYLRSVRSASAGTF